MLYKYQYVIKKKMSSIWSYVVTPDVKGTCRGRASHLCDQQQLECS